MEKPTKSGERKVPRGPFTALQITHFSKPGQYHHKDGLYLLISSTGGKSWAFRYRLNGRQRWLGLGSLKKVTLQVAVLKAAEARVQVGKGVDPVKQKKEQRAAEREAEAKSKTLREAVVEYLEAKMSGWRSEKYKKDWLRPLEVYVFPTLENQPISTLKASQVAEVLKPIWAEIPQTAQRVRARIEMALDYGRDLDDTNYRNVAALTKAMSKVLPEVPKQKKRKNFDAMPYSKIVSFMPALRAETSLVARALEFLILTAARSIRVRHAQWDEFDLDAAVWEIPADRMKTESEFRVPLSKPALAIVADLRRELGGKYLFHGTDPDKPLRHNAMLDLLIAMGHGPGRDHAVSHGFRATFRSWAAARTDFEKEICEVALSHKIGDDDTDRAYQRDDYFDKRRELMDMWAQFLALPPAEANNVVLFRTMKRFSAA